MTRQTHSNFITKKDQWSNVTTENVVFYRIFAKYHLKYGFRIIKISEKSAKYAHDGFQKDDFDARQVTLHHFLHIKYTSQVYLSWGAQECLQWLWRDL